MREGASDRPRTMQQIQERGHPRGHDYRSGSPHLAHGHLYRRLLGQIRALIEMLRKTSHEVSVLDVGAGHGSFSGQLLTLGCRVVATEMSRPSIDHLLSSYGDDPNFSAILDADGSLERLGDRRFDLLLYASVVHHIPDYIGGLRSSVKNHLRHGGAVLTFQDPLWYARLSRISRTLSLVAYFSWRLTQGNIKRGVATRWRRFRRVYREDDPADMVEYHVTRQGVDEQALVREFSLYFDDVVIFRYWSTQSKPWQRIGERLGLVNTFCLRATGYDPSRM
jgi:2-polyprenyl-6-hydroxyphenyl methylase / 3-demethylubiquinone-9 3-methyltransferase